MTNPTTPRLVIEHGLREFADGRHFPGHLAEGAEVTEYDFPAAHPDQACSRCHQPMCGHTWQLLADGLVTDCSEV